MSKQLARKQKPFRDVSGKIGIFWWYDETLLASVCHVDEGEVAGGTVDSKFNHVGSWPALQKRHPRLRKLEYDDMPRGRVIYVRKSKKFRVLMDKALFQPHIKAVIMAWFGLAKSQTSFLTDEHYTTDLVEIDRMLGGQL
jgi:hypothetical protein